MKYSREENLSRQEVHTMQTTYLAAKNKQHPNTTGAVTQWGAKLRGLLEGLRGDGAKEIRELFNTNQGGAIVAFSEMVENDAAPRKPNYKRTDGVSLIH